MFRVKRTRGIVSVWLLDWDSEWIASFTPDVTLALDFKRNKVAENAVKYLEHRLPVDLESGDKFAYEVV